MDATLDIAARRGKTSSARKAAGDKAERQADLAFLARQKKRGPTDPKDSIPWSVVKKRNGL